MRNKNFNDWAVALIVIACSIMLFLASGIRVERQGARRAFRPLRVNFHDVTELPGPRLSSPGRLRERFPASGC